MIVRGTPRLRPVSVAFVPPVIVRGTGVVSITASVGVRLAVGVGDTPGRDVPPDVGAGDVGQDPVVAVVLGPAARGTLGAALRVLCHLGRRLAGDG